MATNFVTLRCRARSVASFYSYGCGCRSFATVFILAVAAATVRKIPDAICKEKNQGMFGSKDSQRNFRGINFKEKESLDTVWNGGTLISFSKERKS